MAYEKQNWQSGDVITSAKLNHMEDGIAGAGGTLVIGGFSYDNYGNILGTSDKTWQEIDDALAAGARCVIVFTVVGGHEQQIVYSTSFYEGEYTVNTETTTATTTSADGYPTAEGQDG